MFTKTKETPSGAPVTPTQTVVNKPAKPNMASTPSIIGSDVQIVGNISTAGEVQLDGIVEGDLLCGSLTLGEHGTVSGGIAADTVIVRGRVEGQIRGRSVRLEKSAKVQGDVWHETLSVEAGAQITGKMVHTNTPLKGVEKVEAKSEAKQAAPAPAAKPQAAKPEAAKTQAPAAKTNGQAPKDTKPGQAALV